MSNDEKCVCCGATIPEGRQYCVICGYKAEKKITNYDRMPTKEVLKIVTECGLNVETTVHDEVMKQIKNALEKQIPKKPNYKSEYLMHFCPNCDYPLPLSFKFCNHCGQALDWSDTE